MDTLWTKQRECKILLILESYAHIEHQITVSQFSVFLLHICIFVKIVKLHALDI